MLSPAIGRILVTKDPTLPLSPIASRENVKSFPKHKSVTLGVTQTMASGMTYNFTVQTLLLFHMAASSSLPVCYDIT